MKVTLESTSKIVHLNGQPCRIWEGVTEWGIKCHAYIKFIAHNDNDNEVVEQLFQKELERVKDPSAEVEAIPLRMIT